MTLQVATIGGPPAVLLVVSDADRRLARQLRIDLRRRGFVANLGEPGSRATTDATSLGTALRSIVFVPHNPSNPGFGVRALRHVDQVAGRAPVIVLADIADERIDNLSSQPEAIVRYGGGGLDYDGVFEQILGLLLGPLPTWLDLRAAPSLLVAPTGVAWWADDLLVADEHSGQVVRIGAADTRMVVAGLREPHHLHLDRHKLLVTDKGGQRVLVGTLEGGSVHDVRSVMGTGGLLHPNGVHQAEGILAIADTDHHRVVFTTDDLWASHKRPVFDEVEASGGFRYPCGVLVDRDFIWIADTFHHRLVAADHAGLELTEFAGYGWSAGRFAYPTSLARWSSFLFVADAEARRVQTFRVEHDDTLNLATQDGLGVAEGELGRPWIAHPFGLAVNHNGRLAVADRLRRCVWLVDLPTLAERW